MGAQLVERLVLAPRAPAEIAGARVELVGRMEKYSEQCDELRKTLEQYKLDAGELLPPPARTRLDVSLLSEDGRMLVQQVGEDSRGQRIGLRPGDVIRKVDGNEVANVGVQPHELVVVKIAEGKTVDDVTAWYRTPSGPPPFA